MVCNMKRDDILGPFWGRLKLLYNSISPKGDNWIDVGSSDENHCKLRIRIEASFWVDFFMSCFWRHLSFELEFVGICDMKRAQGKLY